MQNGAVWVGARLCQVLSQLSLETPAMPFPCLAWLCLPELISPRSIYWALAPGWVGEAAGPQRGKARTLACSGGRPGCDNG